MTARVLVIGLDAAEPTILERLADDGRLPVVDEIRRHGVTARLSNSLRTLPGAIWPELATGVAAGRSALYFHPRQLRTGEAVARPLTAGEIDADVQYWAVAAAAGKRALTIDVPQSVPAPTADAVQLLEWGLHDRTFSVSSKPPELLADIRARFGDHPVAVCDAAHGSTIDGYRRMVDGLRRGVEAKATFASELIAGDDWDLATVVFAETHCVGHQCFHFQDPTHRHHDPAAPDDLVAAIDTVYADIDAAAGRLIDAAGPDATVLVVASHGMGPYVGGYQLLAPVLAALGYGPQRAAHVKPPKPFLPLRRAVRRALPSGVRDRRDAARRADPATYTKVVFTDPSQRAAVVDNNRCGAVRLNVLGREPSGAVAPSDVAATLEELRTEIEALRDPATGEPIVERVQTAHEAFGPDHHPDVPDLVVAFRSDLGPLEACASPRVGLVERSFLSPHTPRSGDHTPESRLWARGLPGAASPATLDADVLDLAPTILDLLGVDPPGALDGRSLAGRPAPAP